MGMLTAMAARFRTNQDGNVTIFSTMMVVLILLITGASVDIMRFEATRAKLQSTMDRAVLAAADLDQEQDPTAVVNDYMTKAGLGSGLGSVTVDQGMNYRTVSASGSVDLNTIFLHMSGFDTLTAPALSTAEEKISNVEISLVLDVSGSMAGDKIENLKDAAGEFIDTVIQPYEEGSGLSTISLVPYNATVSLGDEVSDYWTLDDLHDYSHCPIFEASDFYSTAIYPTTELTRLAHFDLYSSSESTTEIPNPWCPTGTENAVIMHSANATELKNHVNSFDANGNTAIDLGVKWGAALLDPAARPAVAAAAADGRILAEAAARPSDLDDAEVIKFIVVMTDGANTTEYDLEPEYKYGYSDVWVDDRGTASLSDDRYSLLVDDNYGTDNDVYFWERYENSGGGGGGGHHGHGGGGNNNANNRYDNFPDGGTNARRMTNPELFARFGTKGVAKKMYKQPYYDGYISHNKYNDVYYGYESIVNSSAADARLSNICSAARDQGIIIFAIAFEAQPAGEAALADCASSAAHYFEVEGAEITETFHAIARQINSLRLIQ